MTASLAGSTVPRMVTCPKCRSAEVYVQGTRYEARWSRPWFPWQRSRPLLSAAALDVTCSDCWHQFVSRESGTTDLPVQTAAVIRAAAAREVAAVPEGEKPERPKTAPLPRPAGDPRVRKR